MKLVPGAKKGWGPLYIRFYIQFLDLFSNEKLFLNSNFFFRQAKNSHLKRDGEENFLDLIRSLQLASSSFEDILESQQRGRLSPCPSWFCFLLSDSGSTLWCRIPAGMLRASKIQVDTCIFYHSFHLDRNCGDLPSYISTFTFLVLSPLPLFSSWSTV